MHTCLSLLRVYTCKHVHAYMEKKRRVNCQAGLKGTYIKQLASFIFEVLGRKRGGGKSEAEREKKQDIRLKRAKNWPAMTAHFANTNTIKQTALLNLQRKRLKIAGLVKLGYRLYTHGRHSPPVCCKCYSCE